MNHVGTKVVITGGEGDLARELHTHLSQAGFEISAPGRQHLDVAHTEQVREYFATQEVDLLICNAGITRDHILARLTEKNWDEVMQVNLLGVVDTVRAAIPVMKSRGRGSIVLISSYSAMHPPLGQCAYATAKAALLGMVSEMSHQLGQYNIRINAILPGFLETKMTKDLAKERKQEVMAQHALRRLNTGREVASFIRHLHCELIHTSGQVFQLDSR